MRYGERERERESIPLGVSSQTHLKELYFCKRGAREAKDLSMAASLEKKRKKKKAEPH